MASYGRVRFRLNNPASFFIHAFAWNPKGWKEKRRFEPSDFQRKIKRELRMQLGVRAPAEAAIAYILACPLPPSDAARRLLAKEHIYFLKVPEDWDPVDIITQLLSLFQSIMAQMGGLIRWCRHCGTPRIILNVLRPVCYGCGARDRIWHWMQTGPPP